MLVEFRNEHIHVQMKNEALKLATKKLHCSKALESLKGENLEQRTGINIVLNAIRQPIKMIATNAGVSGDVVCEKVLASKDSSFGYDAVT